MQEPIMPHIRAKKKDCPWALSIELWDNRSHVSREGGSISRFENLGVHRDLRVQETKLFEKHRH